mmetsp:Transcript_14386/g.33235  ORF Transcript_14386/g.33235 Transcript_14386/m.33235 type:complete len:274 (+) Transcript_14386:235-1056(+)
MCCTSINPTSAQDQILEAFHQLRSSCRSALEEPGPTTFFLQKVSAMERFSCLRRKAYAIKERDGSPSKPVCFHEGQEVLRRLATKFWPGPVAICLRVSDDAAASLPKEILVADSRSDGRYLRLAHASHPLADRLLRETDSQRIVVGAPARRTTTTMPDDVVYMTKASDVCTHFLSQPCREKQEKVYVLNGEDRCELFTVPTCQYKKPCATSLWIHDADRTVYMRGEKDDQYPTTDRELLKAISSRPRGEGDNRHRDRVIAVVLRRWKIVDERV